MDTDCCLGDDWGRLEETLTNPGWISLKWVSLAMEIAYWHIQHVLTKVQPNLWSMRSGRAVSTIHGHLLSEGDESLYLSGC
jgi:hypothetical protein